MNTGLSDNANAILLLTAPLLVGKGKADVNPLTLSEYNKLARHLAETGSEPADLLMPGWEESFAEWQSGFDAKRIGSLLERGVLLSLAIVHWQERDIWVVSRADDEYPQRLKERLGPNAPPVLYGCGNRDLLENGGLAVVGSRNTSEELLDSAQNIGRLAAASDCSIISGAARGVDQAAMYGALQKWGTAAGVLTCDLERESLNHEHRDMLMEGNLVLISPYDPKAGFNVGNAMQRNKLIYALADAGLVVESDYNKGGTWNGAIEQLEKLRFVPVYSRSEGDISAGLRGLRRKGALEWPNPQTPDEFRAVLTGEQLLANVEEPKLDTLWTNIDVPAELDRGNAATHVIQSLSSAGPPKTPDTCPADTLFATVEHLIDSMGASVTEFDVIDHLQVEKKQAQAWLKRLVDEGKYKKLNRPARYVKALQLGPMS